MTRLAALVAAVLTITAAAAAGTPPGVAESRALEPAAAFVAGKPMRVYCPSDTLVWKDLAAAHAATLPGERLAGFAPRAGADEIYLAPAVCDELGGLTAWWNPKPVIGYPLAQAVLTIVHEAIHARGERDEGVTDCAAVHEMPRAAVLYFKVKPGKQLRALMAYAWKIRAGLPPAYRTVC